MIPPITPSATWIERYETLRRHVLQGCQIFDSEPLSLVLWLAQGMAGWMRHWSRAVEVVSSPAVFSSPPLPLVATSLWQQQLTLLLAQITVQHLYPVARL
jgi:hypothetical protein